MCRVCAEVKMNIKILVCYHKKDFLFKNNVLVPIHCGRAVATQKHKDGQISDDDYRWLISNMLGDDTGDNISDLNREVNEMTAIYWAWKNYDKLGNPDYIGLCHYRRLFNFSGVKFYRHKNKIISGSGQNTKNISKYLKKSDFITRTPVYCNDLLLEIYNSMQDIIQLSETNHPELYKSMQDLINTRKYYCTNMFIMSRADFFKYCETVFPVMFKFLNNKNRGTLFLEHIQTRVDKQTLSNFDDGRFWLPRLTGFLMEYITGFYLRHLMETKKHSELEILNTEECVQCRTLIKQIFSVDNETFDNNKYWVVYFMGLKMKIKRIHNA